MKRRRTAGHVQLSLTEREHTVLALIADGLANAAIAEQLSLSRHTVAWHIKQIFSKLGVNRRTQAVAVAHSLGALGESRPVSQPHAILPAPLTPLLGRETELSQLLDLLAEPDTRLVTIIGPGGIGKTRLALAAAHKLRRRSMPAYFVSLEGVASAEHVIPAIAEAIDLHFHGQLDPRQQILNVLQNRRLVLVLDNFEHLLGAAPLVVDMLSSAPKLKALVTSRERLNLHGETVLTLDGLAYPTNERLTVSGSAVELFLQTTRRRQPDFRPGDEDRRHVGRICRLVEGLPLALELAAGWIHLLSPAQIASEIEKRLDILETSARDVPARHRSIHAVFAHSWHLLTEEECAVFARLSVFKGGFTQEAAEYVAGASVHSLRALLDKCCIRLDTNGRYSVHELLRQFGAEKLETEVDVRRQTLILHARHYLQIIYQRQPEIEGENLPKTIREIRADMDNIWAAWRMAGEHGLALEIAQAARSFTILHTSSGLVPTLFREIEQVTAHLRKQPDSPFVNLALARTLIYLSPNYAKHSAGEFLQLVNEAGMYLDKIENPSDVDRAVYLTFRGMALVSLERYEQAVDQLQTATELCQRIDGDTVSCFAPAIHAIALIELDQYERAELIMEQAQKTVVCFSAFFFRAHLLPLLALIGTGLHRYDNARQWLLEAIDENRRYTQIVSFDLLLLGVAQYLYALGSLERALEILYLYFQPALVNLYLQHKARNLLAELESRLPMETRTTLSVRANSWLAESPSLVNPLGLRPDFLDYVAQLVVKPGG